MKILFTLFLFGFLTGCQTFGVDFDPKAMIDKAAKEDGPMVTGVEQSILDSVRQAEEEGNYERAAQSYKQLLDKDSSSVRYKVGYAESLRRTGDYDQALAVFESVIADEPKNIDALEGKALSLMATGEVSDAGKLFQQVMRLDSKRWRTLNAVGVLFAMKGKLDEALQYFEEALKVRPGNASVLNNTGLVLAIQRKFMKAESAMLQARKQLSKDSVQRKHLDLNLALIYGIGGKIDAAESVASEHLSEAALNNNLGFYAYLANNEDLAKAYLNKALSGSNEYYERAWNNLEAIGGQDLKPNR